jgi:hypothetical protein
MTSKPAANGLCTALADPGAEKESLESGCAQRPVRPFQPLPQAAVFFGEMPDALVGQLEPCF